MSTKSHMLIHYHLQDCNVLMKKVSSPCVWNPCVNKALEVKKIIFLSRYGMGLFIFSLVLIYKISYLEESRTLRKKLCSTRRYAKIHIQKPILTMKKALKKLLYWNQTVGARLGDSSIYSSSKNKKIQNLNFWSYFKIPQANCLWANLGKFR